jgi:hypothetical protein
LEWRGHGFVLPASAAGNNEEMRRQNEFISMLDLNWSERLKTTQRNWEFL